MNANGVRAAPRIIPEIVQQHVDDAASLHATRSRLTHAPHVRLRKLSDFDDRIAAHLEGLQIAGDAATPMCEAALESGGSSAMFVAAMRALESRDSVWLQRLLMLSDAEPACGRGFIAAFGWTEKSQLRGVVADYLKSELPGARLVALAACGQHRVDPNSGFTRVLQDAAPLVRARAYRTAGELGKRELVSGLNTIATSEEDATCQFWAAWSAVVLGDRGNALELLKEIATQPGPFRARAFQLAFQAADMGAARGLLQVVAKDPAGIRHVIQGAGLSGDATYIPRLIDLMAQDRHARVAGEAFSLITGVDSEWLDLERLRPEGFESGPNDDPEDSNVDPDEDDGLPWPDRTRVQLWWNANSQRFQPGTRYFMGAPLNRENCIRVLRDGFQRQRIAAALYLSLLTPGAPLFEWRAPTWRQARTLAQLS